MGLVLALVGQTVPAMGQSVPGGEGVSPGRDRVELSRMAWSEIRARAGMEWLAAAVVLQGALRGELGRADGPEARARRALTEPDQVISQAVEGWVELAIWADQARTGALYILGQDQDSGEAPVGAPAWLDQLRPWLVRVTAGQPGSRALALAVVTRLALGEPLGQPPGRSLRPLASAATAAERKARRVQRELALFRATQAGPFDGYLADAAEKFGLDVFLFKGLIENESGLNPNLASRKVVRVVEGKKRIVSGGATGIAQFTPGGIRGVNNLRRRKVRAGEPIELFTLEKARRPEKAIPAAAELLAHLVELFGRDGGVTAYNTGPVPGKAVARYGFYEARRMGLLCKVTLGGGGSIQVQGERFLLNVLRRTNRLRAEVGLPPLDPPKDRKRTLAGREPLPAETPSGG